MLLQISRCHRSTWLPLLSKCRFECIFRICHVLTLIVSVNISIARNVLAFEDKVCHIWRTCIVHIYCAARLIDSVGLFTLAVLALLLITISEISYCILVWFFSSETAVAILQDSYICTETPVSRISLIELMYLHFPNFVFFPKRTMHTRQLSEAISFTRGTYLVAHCSSCMWVQVKNVSSLM